MYFIVFICVCIIIIMSGPLTVSIYTQINYRIQYLNNLIT